VQMRLVTFSRKGSDGFLVGVELPEKKVVVNLNAALNRPDLTMKKLLELGDAGLAAARKASQESKHTIPLGDVIIKAPIHDPQKVICIGMNYVDHCLEQNYPIPKEPIVFSKFANAIADPGDEIIKENTEELDWEVELVIVIGKGGKHISKASAMEHVVGYTVAHDVSARDWQLKKNGAQWLLGKTSDGYAPLGPAIVTKDEIKDPHNLGIRCFVNGKVVQNSNTNQLIFRTEDLIEWCSRFFTLTPGDIILTGSPPGVGVFRKPPVFLHDGDVVTVEIDGIGRVTNTVRDPSLRPLKHQQRQSPIASKL